MKRKITIVLLGIVCAVCLAFGLAACGGGNRLKVSVTEFEDAGIDQINIYAGNSEDFSKDDDNSLSSLQLRGSCYYSSSGFSTIEFDGGTYAGVVTIKLKESHIVGGSWMNNNLALSIKVNGTECDLLPTSLFEHNPFGSSNYWALIGEDGVFSGDLTIELVGNTTIKTYKPTITLKDYDAYKNDERCQGLKFKAEVAQRQDSGELSAYAPFEYNSKTEFTATEFKEAMENSSFTYFDEVKVSAYFENKAKFFPYRECAHAFIGDRGNATSDLEIEWTMNYSFTDWQKITLDFAGFDAETVGYLDESGSSALRVMTLEDMTKVKLTRGWFSGDMFKTMYQEDNVKFIVDGTEKDELTVEDYYKADNIKVKSIVSELGAKILRDESMFVVTSSDFGVSNRGPEQLEGEKRLTQSEIIIGNAVVGNPGYKEVTLDFGNYKAFKAYAGVGYGKYTTLELNIYATEPTGDGGYYYNYYTDSLLASLQKVDFEDASTGEFNGYENKWKDYRSAYDMENQIALAYLEDGREYNTGCYYAGDELAFYLGSSGGLHGSDYVHTLELTISIEGEEDKVITFTGDGWSYWEMVGTYEDITCETVDSGTLLVIKSSKITKISGKVTVEHKT